MLYLFFEISTKTMCKMRKILMVTLLSIVAVFSLVQTWEIRAEYNCYLDNNASSAFCYSDYSSCVASSGPNCSSALDSCLYGVGNELYSCLNTEFGPFPIEPDPNEYDNCRSECAYEMDVCVGEGCPVGSCLTAKFMCDTACEEFNNGDT